MPLSPQLTNALNGVIGPHNTNELAAALAKPTDPVLRLNANLDEFDRRLNGLRQDLEAALLRIEHLENPVQAENVKTEAAA
jgi:hypothetical protein